MPILLRLMSLIASVWGRVRPAKGKDAPTPEPFVAVVGKIGPRPDKAA